jgi:hypothetical protein
MSKDVPRWKQLPDYARNELALRGYGGQWLDSRPDAIRLTVLNLYVKLRGMDLWKFVLMRGESTPVGCLEFLTTNVALLKQELTTRWQFRNPEDSTDEWHSPEKRLHGAVHFKHFKGWPVNKVQAHIDRFGRWLGQPQLFWAGQPVGVPILLHLADYLCHGWEHVLDVREILLEQGWDPQPLLGVGVWHCAARDCPGHSRPEHRCQQGIWFCGRRLAPCPGHGKPTDQCRSGRAWHCGARNCPTHSQPEHRCPAGVWYCGRTQPPCPGHGRREHRCRAGAALLYANPVT